MFFPNWKHHQSGTLLCLSFILGIFVPAVQAQEPIQENREPVRIMTAVKPIPQEAVEGTRAASKAQNVAGLPIWNYFTESTRDFFGYSGTMIGRDPFNGGGGVSIPTNIVPLVIVTHSIATGINNKGDYTIKPGATVFDPTAPDNACMAAPNNVPLTVVRQSPLFEDAAFNFGGTNVGTTQYINAFQRAEFWKALGNGASEYHTLLQPVRPMAPIVIDVPANHGLARPKFLNPASATICGPQGRVDIDWFDTYLNDVVIPELSAKGVAPSTLPVFLVYNTVFGIPAIDPRQCCILGYHSGTAAIPIQTYAVSDFDETAFFGSSFKDVTVMSHELAEWANDPFVGNFTPGWGNTGQVIGSCQYNLEVGDPLTGIEAPRIAMPNGFTYHLQELAFYSWFFGAPSVGIHGWFSNNGTFLTDAGPPCVPPPAPSSADSKPKWIVR